MRAVVEAEGGCIVWGGNVRLSPADDILIRVERPLDFDSEGQLVASVLSKKIAAGSTHVVIDVPIGPTAKVRTEIAARALADRLTTVGTRLGIHVDVQFSDGLQPVGRGIGPALEARDVLAVLRREAGAPADLKERALMLAGRVLEFSPGTPAGSGMAKARQILDSGLALRKFEAICEAQGGFRDPPRANHTYVATARVDGRCTAIDNRRMARLAKLAGAPRAPAAGIEMHTRLGMHVQRGEPLFTLHAEAPGELQYALGFLRSHPDMIRVEAQ
jgi:thymidine phosphorylase